VRARLAWILAGVTAVLVLADIVVAAQALPLTSETAVAVHGFPFVHGAVLGSALMGALIISRYERHPIGWLLAFVGIAGSLSLLAEAYAYWVQEADGPGPSGLASVSAWIAALLGGQLETAAIALMFLLAPDGHLLSPRWRYAVWTVAAGVLLHVLAIVSVDPGGFLLVTAEERIGPVRNAMLSLGFTAISAGLVASVVSMMRRRRVASPEQRQQLRLVALAAALPAGSVVWMLLVQELNGGRQTWVSALPLFISFFLMPILLAVAVLRDRLYELDVIINRTAVVIAATAFAAVGYTTLVVLVASLVETRTGGFWLSLLGTAFVAVAFQPVRRRVVRLANRLAYGSRAQPYEELADFSSRLVESPSAEALLPTVAAAAGEALAARSATATLGGRSAHWGEASSDANAYAAAVGEDGTIEVALPRGRGLRSSDERLLRALAEQAAVAFRNVAMEAELASHVAALDLTTAELARSRARLVEADDAVRRDLEAAISRDVLPHLVAVADGLRSGGSVEPLIDEVSTGLEALRELTRGVFPAQLARAGIEPALRSFPLTLDHALSGRRFAARVEAAVYFCCTQTRASSAELTPSGTDPVLTLFDVDDVPQDVVDRVEAAGGSVSTSDHVLSVVLPALG
jgi:hypothetical protein